VAGLKHAQSPSPWAESSSRALSHGERSWCLISLHFINKMFVTKITSWSFGVLIYVPMKMRRFVRRNENKNDMKRMKNQSIAIFDGEKVHGEMSTAEKNVNKASIMEM
jgi:hypothetical protein